MKIQPISHDAYDLLHNSTLVLAKAERAGIHVDVPYCLSMREHLKRTMLHIDHQLEETKLGKIGRGAYGKKLNLGSDEQLSKILFEKMGLASTGETATGKPSVRAEALETLIPDVPELELLLKKRKLQTAKDTFLVNFVAAAVDGFMHPFFNLGTVRTYRSCVAKGTFIEIVRDLSKNPKGILIENVKKGDYAYCYNDSLKLTIKKIKWAGQTGVRNIIRLHWSARGKKGFVDVTPEHKIRLATGKYVEARKLITTQRPNWENVHCPKVHTLALGRGTGKKISLLYETGNNKAVLDHRLVYSIRYGHLSNTDILHHKDGNHFNNIATNLQKTNLSNHAIIKIEYLNKKVPVYDIEVEGCHNFIANEICVHNSSELPNFQNIPNRDPEIKRICRTAIIPRKGRKICSIDFSSIEVRIGACYHQDPTMIAYIENPASDMHRDMAQEVYRIDKTMWKKMEELDKQNDTRYAKNIRHSGKSEFVFPEFYGDWYETCAWDLWHSAKKPTHMLPGGIQLADHLASKELSSLKKFETHLEKVEHHFWYTRFLAYSEWKEQWWEDYQARGYFDMLTKFRCQGAMSKKETANYPIQGTAFHCMLASLIDIDEFLGTKYKTLLLGQIHDEVILDLVPDEQDDILGEIKDIMTAKLRAKWSWLIVPIEVELSITDVDDSWYNKKEIKI